MFGLFKKKNIHKVDIEITAEEHEFLKNLARKVKTQDNVGTALPLFHQIRTTHKEWGIDTDYAEGIGYTFGDDYWEGEPLEEADKIREYLYDHHEDKFPEGNELDSIDDPYWIKDMCEEEDIEVNEIGYRKVERYHNSFITREAAQKHLETNHYHYPHGVVYTCHGWRNPELEKLLKIVEKFD